MPLTSPHPLSRNAASNIAYFSALIMAVGMILHLYPMSFLAGYGAYFQGGDAASNVAGWLFFREDDWHFPLLHSTRLNTPEGTSIAFTDSIPLLALLLKPLHSWLPEGFHYFGMWHAFCYLLQAGAAVFLLRSLNVRHLPGALLAAAFALTWPALTHRMGHTALMTHGVLLVALGLYFRGLNSATWSMKRTGTAFIALSCAALLIHPYLLAMVYPLFIAFLASQWLSCRLSIKQALLWAAYSLATLLVLMYAGGYLVGERAAAEGFGIYSINLTGPFCGGMLCEEANATGGQGEGYNYFGAGALLLILIALVTHGRGLLRAAPRHLPLLLVLIGFALYAVSNRIYFGQHALLEIPLPSSLESILGVFRVSGRFFWPVGYCLLFVSLAVLLRRPGVIMLVIMLAALLLQWQDTRELREQVQSQARLPDNLDLDPWRPALAGLDGIDIYPAYGCSDTPPDDHLRYQYIAASLGLTINSAYSARSSRDCARKHAFAHAPAEPGRLYVKAGFQRNPLDLPAVFQQGIAAGHCLIEGVHLICSSTGYAGPGAIGSPLQEQQGFTMRWAAAQLPSVIGHVQDQRLVPREPDTVGYLSYGPYITLAPGTYQHNIEYLSEADAGTTVGTWDLVGRDSSGELLILAAGPLMGTQGEPLQLEGSLSLNRTLQRTELRVFSNGENIQLEAISLSSNLKNNDN